MSVLFDPVLRTKAKAMNLSRRSRGKMGSFRTCTGRYVPLIFISFVLVLVWSHTYGFAVTYNTSMVPPSPPDGATITAAPVTLAVITTDGSGAPVFNDTEFWVQIPNTVQFVMVEWTPPSGVGGTAAIVYNPPFSGTYHWEVRVDINGDHQHDPEHPDPSDQASSEWSFTCAVATTTYTQLSTTTKTQSLTTTSVQWSITTYTQTVGVVTEFSYLYETVTSATTSYRTQTVSTTRTASVQSTMTKTSTAFATTETAPVTLHYTESTTQTETSYATVSLTQYVYIDSYTAGQIIESVTIPQIPSGSESSAHFSKGDKHKIQTITVGVIDNATNVKVAIATAPGHTNVISNSDEYESFQIGAANLPDSNIKSAVIEFKVDMNWLSNNHVQPGKVNLYRYENGEWTKLETSLLRTDDAYAYYSAASPGLSIFAIAGQPSSYFQIPGIVPLPDSYALIACITLLGTLGAYAGIRIRSTRLENGESETHPEDSAREGESEDRIDGRLLEYIRKHGGSISLSKAAQEFGVLPTAIKESIARLKSGGKLTPA